MDTLASFLTSVLGSGSHACAVSMLPSGPSPQPTPQRWLLKSPVAAKPKKFPQSIRANPRVAQRPDPQAGTLPAPGPLGLPGLMLSLAGTAGDVPRMIGWQEDGPSPGQPINNSISKGPAEAGPIPALLGTDKPQEPS